MKNMQAEYLPDLLRGNTDILLLSLIDEMGSTYGYQMIKEIDKRSRGFLQCKEGTIYPALRKLENDGLTKGEWRVLPNGLRRRYYQVTLGGQEVLAKKLAIWQEFTAAVNLVFKPVKT
ncbi:MAG: PadR family transcriptional regulator [Dehalococcoidia bacterium]|nr:MAG: PadR family transcriptional regulator [Dehalococcoidia bacterium]